MRSTGHVLAWEAAERLNRTVRLPEFTPTSATRRHAGEDLSVLCNVTAEQRRNVLSSTGADCRPFISVTVGAVTVDVHTTSAVRSIPNRSRCPQVARRAAASTACGRTLNP